MALPERELADVSSVRRKVTLQILQERGIDELIARMFSYPAEIRKAQEAAAAARQAVQEIEAEVRLAEAVLTAQIAAEVDSKTEKPAFSNDTARKAELAKRKTTDADYKAAAQKLAEAEQALQSAELTVEQLEREFSAVRHAVDIQREVFAALTR